MNTIRLLLLFFVVCLIVIFTHTSALTYDQEVLGRADQAKTGTNILDIPSVYVIPGSTIHKVSEREISFVTEKNISEVTYWYERLSQQLPGASAERFSKGDTEYFLFATPKRQSITVKLHQKDSSSQTEVILIHKNP